MAEAPEGRQNSKGDSLLQDGDCRGVVCNVVGLLLCQLSILGTAPSHVTALQSRLSPFKASYTPLCTEEAVAQNAIMPDQACFASLDNADQARCDGLNNTN